MLFQSVTQAAQKKKKNLCTPNRSRTYDLLAQLYSCHRVYPNKLNRLKTVEKLHRLQSQSGHISETSQKDRRTQDLRGLVAKTKITMELSTTPKEL